MIKKNIIIFGRAGSGKAFHPWDGLNLCECGHYPWMEGRRGGAFEQGAPYRIVCRHCGRHTQPGDVQTVKDAWNNRHAIK